MTNLKKNPTEAFNDFLVSFDFAEYRTQHESTEAKNQQKRMRVERFLSAFEYVLATWLCGFDN